MKETGEMVQTGEIIAKVKVVSDMNRLSSVQSHVCSAQTDVKQAKVNYDYEKKLYDEGLVTSDRYDRIRQAYQQPQEEVKATRDNLEVVCDGVPENNADTSSTLIRSTISGSILDVPMKVSSTVILNSTFNDGTIIAVVANMGDLIFRGSIGETEVGQLSVGMPMKITIKALQDSTLQASLEYVSSKAVEQSNANRFEVKAAIHSTQGKKIHSGYSVNTEIVLTSIQNVLAVPGSAIEFSGKRTHVYVVKGDKDNETYEQRKAETGMSNGLNIEIRSGSNKSEGIRGSRRVKKD